MPRPSHPIFRMIALAALAGAIAFGFLQWWAWTASHSWSSDAWLMAVPIAMVLLGIASGVALVVLIRGTRR